MCIPSLEINYIPALGDGKFGAAEPTHSLISSFSDESESRSVLSDSLQPHGLSSPWDSPGQNTGVGSLSLLQEIFPTQGSNPGLPYCRQILYQLNHKGNPPLVIEFPSFTCTSDFPGETLPFPAPLATLCPCDYNRASHIGQEVMLETSGS